MPIVNIHVAVFMTKLRELELLVVVLVISVGSSLVDNPSSFVGSSFVGPGMHVNVLT